MYTETQQNILAEIVFLLVKQGNDPVDAVKKAKKAIEELYKPDVK